MSKTREEQLILEGTAYDNFINAVRSKSSQKFYLVGLKKFMAYNNIQNVSDMLAWDQRLIEAKIISWLVNMRDKESLAYITIQSYLSAVMTFYKAFTSFNDSKAYPSNRRNSGSEKTTT